MTLTERAENFRRRLHEERSGEYELVGNYKSMSKHATIRHTKCGHEWDTKPCHLIYQKINCPKCSREQKTDRIVKYVKEIGGPSQIKPHSDFLEEIRSQVGYDYTSLEDYKGYNTLIKLKHNSCQHVFKMRPANFLGQGSRCPKCSEISRRKNFKETLRRNPRTAWNRGNTEEYKHKVYHSRGHEYTVLGEYVDNRTPIKMMHNACGHIFYMTPNSFYNQESICPECMKLLLRRRYSRGHEEFTRIVKEDTQDEYEVLERYMNSHTPIKMKHNLCGHVWKVYPGHFVRGSRCPGCRESSGETRIRHYLVKKGIRFEREYRIEGCKRIRPLPFDFALFDKDGNVDTVIEYMGEQHYIPLKHIGGQERLRYIQNNDQIKHEYCRRNNIDLIIISYTQQEEIENILKERLA